MAGHKNEIIVFGLLIVLALQCILSMRLKSPTFDEVGHLPAGYSYLKTNDFRLYPINPPLIKQLAAIPLVFMKLRLPLDHPAWERANAIQFGRQFLYRYNRERADKIIFLGRLVIVLLSILLGYFVFKWAKALHGIRAGLFALFLYSFDPNILAHSRLVTADLGFTCFMFIALYCFHKFIKVPSKANSIVAGLTFGLTLVSKHTAIILVPSYLSILLIHIWVSKRRRLFDNFAKSVYIYLLGLLLIFAIGFFVIFVDYGFELTPLAKESDDIAKLKFKLNQIPISNNIKQKICDLAQVVPIPARTYFTSLGWISGFTPRLQGGLPKGHGIFLMGKHSSEGFWYYSLVAFLIKTPIPLMILLIVAIATIKKQQIIEIIYFFVPITILIIVGLKRQTFAYRYVILPILPLIHVFVSRIVNKRRGEARKLLIGVACLCTWYFISTIKIYPHYLAYFNELIGGPGNGYKYLVGSDLDWGQDLKGLKTYMDKHNIDKIKLSYLGTADPSYYGISYEPLQGISNATYDPEIVENPEENTKPTEGIIAISASCLQNIEGFYPGCSYRWLKKYKPIDNIGYSILIYKIDKRPR